MDMMRGQVEEIAVMSHERFVIFHRGFQRPADDHCSFAGGMPMERSDASWGDLARITDGPFVGSPRSTAIVKHAGAFGTAPNLAVAAAVTIGFSSVPCAAKRAKPMTLATKTTRSEQKCFGKFMRVLI